MMATRSLKLLLFPTIILLYFISPTHCQESSGSRRAKIMRSPPPVQDNLGYIAFEATTLLFNILRNPVSWESNMCPGVPTGQTQISNPGYGIDLLTNVVKYIEALLAITTHHRKWMPEYCGFRRDQIKRKRTLRRKK